MGSSEATPLACSKASRCAVTSHNGHVTCAAIPRCQRIQNGVMPLTWGVSKLFSCPLTTIDHIADYIKGVEQIILTKRKKEEKETGFQ